MNPDALATAGIALGLVVVAEAMAGVLSTVAISEAAALGAVISAQLAAGSLTTALVVTGLLASSLVVVVVAAVIAGYVVAPQLAAALQARSGATAPGSGEQTSFEPSSGFTGSVTVGLTIDAVGNLTVTARGHDPAVDLNAALDSVGLDLSLDPAPVGVPTLNLDLSPVGEPAPPDPGFPGEMGLFAVLEPARAVPAADTLGLLAAGLFGWAAWRRCAA